MQSFQRKGGREVGSKECEANLVLQNVERTFDLGTKSQPCATRYTYAVWCVPCRRCRLMGVYVEVELFINQKIGV